MCYKGYGYPLTLFLEEGGVVTVCKLNTQEPEEPVDFEFCSTNVTNKVDFHYFIYNSSVSLQGCLLYKQIWQYICKFHENILWLIYFGSFQRWSCSQRVWRKPSLSWTWPVRCYRSPCPPASRTLGVLSKLKLLLKHHYVFYSIVFAGHLAQDYIAKTPKKYV